MFGDDVTSCFGKRVLLEPTPMRVAGRELVVIRLKAAPASNGTGPKALPGETKADASDEASGAYSADAHPDTMASS